MRFLDASSIRGQINFTLAYGIDSVSNNIEQSVTRYFDFCRELVSSNDRFSNSGLQGYFFVYSSHNIFHLFLSLVLSFVLSVLVDLINASPQVHTYYSSYSQTLSARIIGNVRLSGLESLWRDQVG